MDNSDVLYSHNYSTLVSVNCFVHQMLADGVPWRQTAYCRVWLDRFDQNPGPPFTYLHWCDKTNFAGLFHSLLINLIVCWCNDLGVSHKSKLKRVNIDSWITGRQKSNLQQMLVSGRFREVEKNFKMKYSLFLFWVWSFNIRCTS